MRATAVCTLLALGSVSAFLPPVAPNAVRGASLRGSAGEGQGDALKSGMMGELKRRLSNPDLASFTTGNKADYAETPEGAVAAPAPAAPAKKEEKKAAAPKAEAPKAAAPKAAAPAAKADDGKHRGVGGMADTRDPDPVDHEDPRKSISKAPTFEEYMKSKQQGK